MKFLTALITTLIGSSALATQGSLEVTVDSLRIERTDGLKSHFFKGKYESSLSFKNQKAYLTIIRKDVRTDAEVKIPAGANIPDNGAFAIDGTKTGQTFDITGTVATTRDQSPTYLEQESCSWNEEEYVCRGRGRRRECRWETVRRYGYREVEFHYLTTLMKLNTELLSDNGGKAKFSGQETSRQKIYTHVGFCR